MFTYRVLAVDRIDSRLEMARASGTEVINFDKEDPLQVILDLTGSISVDRVIDAVGVDAQHPSHGPGADKAKQKESEFKKEVKKVAPQTNVKGQLWVPGDAPSQVLTWAVQSLAKAGTLAIIGVYPETVEFFPLGMAMMKNLTINFGNCTITVSIFLPCSK